MEKQELLNMLREIKSVSIATADELGRPRVRIIDIMLAEENAVYFCTARGKDFYRELMDRKQAAIVGMHQNTRMIRLSGSVISLSEQKKWIDRIFIANPIMNDVYPGASRYILEPFSIRDGELEFFDLSSSPITRESFSLGNAAISRKGFEITDTCAGCGICLEQCPQKCITEDAVYTIQQKHCLHCGLCYEACPVKAVKRRSD